MFNIAKNADEWVHPLNDIIDEILDELFKNDETVADFKRDELDFKLGVIVENQYISSTTSYKDRHPICGVVDCLIIKHKETNIGVHVTIHTIAYDIAIRSGIHALRSLITTKKTKGAFTTRTFYTKTVKDRP